MRTGAAKVVGVFLVVGLAFIGFLHYHNNNDEGVGCIFHCPKHSDKYSHKCLKYALPPWPICRFHPVDHFVEDSIDATTRCCHHDKSECNCPKKDEPEFMDNIKDWCKGVKKYCAEEEQEGENESYTEQPQLAGGEDNEVITSLENEALIPVDHVPILQREEVEQVGFHYHDRRLSWGQKNNAAPDKKCPTDDTYEAKCLESALPPYPYCIQKSVDEWVDQALHGYDRCCGAETGRCKCPKKDTDKFAAKIGDWCAGVETCSSPSSAAKKMLVEAADASTSGLLRASKERLEVEPQEASGEDAN